MNHKQSTNIHIKTRIHTLKYLDKFLGPTCNHRPQTQAAKDLINKHLYPLRYKRQIGTPPGEAQWYPLSNSIRQPKEYPRLVSHSLSHLYAPLSGHMHPVHVPALRSICLPTRGDGGVALQTELSTFYKECRTQSHKEQGIYLLRLLDIRSLTAMTSSMSAFKLESEPSRYMHEVEVSSRAEKERRRGDVVPETFVLTSFVIMRQRHLRSAGRGTKIVVRSSATYAEKASTDATFRQDKKGTAIEPSAIHRISEAVPMVRSSSRGCRLNGTWTRHMRPRSRSGGKQWAGRICLNPWRGDSQDDRDVHRGKPWPLVLDANDRWQPWDMTKKWKETNVLARRPREGPDIYMIGSVGDHAVSAPRAYWWFSSDGEPKAEENGRLWYNVYMSVHVVQYLVVNEMRLSPHSTVYVADLTRGTRIVQAKLKNTQGVHPVDESVREAKEENRNSRALITRIVSTIHRHPCPYTFPWGTFVLDGSGLFLPPSATSGSGGRLSIKHRYLATRSLVGLQETKSEALSRSPLNRKRGERPSAAFREIEERLARKPQLPLQPAYSLPSTVTSPAHSSRYNLVEAAPCGYRWHLPSRIGVRYENSRSTRKPSKDQTPEPCSPGRSWKPRYVAHPGRQ
ncbi:hypothetical protein CPB85DRAFT_1512544 [Mucidula mucida]|nr:hypothetical protein CPB85DRAFT_1512544 [Mucidula mucida]